MKFCPTCGKQLRAGARFCANCGRSLEDETVQENSACTFEPQSEREKGKGKKLFLFLLIGLLGFGVMGYLFMEKNNLSSYDAVAMLEECTGTYKDKTGMLTGKVNGNIIVVSDEGHLEGRGETGNFRFNLVIKDEYQFIGDVNLNGVESRNTVEYDPELERLTFYREGSPLDWYIGKK